MDRELWIKRSVVTNQFSDNNKGELNLRHYTPERPQKLPDICVKMVENGHKWKGQNPKTVKKNEYYRNILLKGKSRNFC